MSDYGGERQPMERPADFELRIFDIKSKGLWDSADIMHREFRLQLESMARGETSEISSEYPGWKKDDFKALIEELDRTY